MKRLLMLVTLALTISNGHAQAPGVPIYNEDRRESQFETEFASAVEKLRNAGAAIELDTVRTQLRRDSCELVLPTPAMLKLNSREVWEIARKSHLRVGWSYLCTRCDDWHLDLAGGYALTTNGAVATCYHVVQPRRDMREGCLIVADEDGNVFPVVEVLAANRHSDACIVRVAGGNFQPLPLNTNVHPGDAVYCFSDPLGRRGYFSQGIVNRFFQLPERRRINTPGVPTFAPIRIDVSTDWAPGSSGSAVLDQFGNAIGHVSSISTGADNEPFESKPKPKKVDALMLFREAVSAHDVLALVKQAQ